MKIVDTDSPLADALAYARSSQHHNQSCVISFTRGMFIVTHDNGHRRAFRKLDGVVLMNRLIADLEVDGFEQLATKRGGR